MEQVAVEEAHGALPSWLHRRGEVLGRGRRLVSVLFEREYSSLTGLRPDLVRLLGAPGEDARAR